VRRHPTIPGSLINPFALVFPLPYSNTAIFPLCLSRHAVSPDLRFVANQKLRRRQGAGLHPAAAWRGGRDGASGPGRVSVTATAVDAELWRVNVQLRIAHSDPDRQVPHQSQVLHSCGSGSRPVFRVGERFSLQVAQDFLWVADTMYTAFNF